MIDYVTLKIVWWAIFCFLVIAFAVTGGRDIGVNFLLLFLGKNENERRLILNSVGPTWEGNQVWLITLGAGLFAIWPIAYATIFSSMYYAFMLVLVMLILRPPGFDYRAKIDSVVWRKTWDFALVFSALVLAVCFGVVIGNFFTGIGFYFDYDLHPIYTGSLLNFFSVPALLCGAASFCIIVLQGALFLQHKLPKPLDAKAKRWVKNTAYAFILIYLATGYYLSHWVNGYSIVAIPDLNSSFMVTSKAVIAKQGWLANYHQLKALWALPIATIIAIYSAVVLSKINRALIALYVNSIAMALAIMTAAASLYPFIMPSNVNPDHSLTIWDVVSSSLTLEWALIALVVLLPVVFAYTIWVYSVMRGKVSLTKESY